jgi:hypothetical protein
MLTIPINNAQNECGNNERKPSHIADSDNCSRARKSIHNASAKVVWQSAVNA